MGYPFGLAKPADGTGTMPADLQRVIWGLYRADDPLIVKGCEVTGTSSMQYKVAAGVVYIPVGAQRGILVPVDAATVQTAAAPSTGSRVDVLYVGQDAGVKVGASAASGSAVLDRRTVMAGTTATTSTTGITDRGYAMLFGASMGMLYNYRDPSPLDSVVNPASHLVCATQVTVPSDRLLDLRVTQTLWSASPASMMWSIYIDNALEVNFEMGVSTVAESKQVTHSRWLLAGTHQIRLEVRRQTGTGNVLYKRGGPSSYNGNRFEVIDLGLSW